MSGFHKNKGIVIELTALLDVIMIMLFWVMMNNSQTAEEARQQAGQANAQRQAAESRLHEVEEDAAKQIEQAKENARNINERAAANQEALDDYQKGLGLTVKISFEDGEDRLYFIRGEEEIESCSVNDPIVAQKFSQVLKDLEYGEEDVILCLVIFDSTAILDKDYEKTVQAMEQVRDEYKYLYCTYINTKN